jgi:hypothetical protein
MMISANPQIFWEKVRTLNLKMFNGRTYPVCEGSAPPEPIDDVSPYVSS